MADKMFMGGSMDILKRSLDAYSLRQKVIAENIAQAETPGYKSRSVKFEELLTRSLQKDGGIAMKQSQGKHMPTTSVGLPNAQVNKESDRAMDNGINDVSIDLEMVALAETSLNHKLATRILAMKYQGLKNAIRGRS
jgi:flagellar basal-body rod protein FlgB